MLGIFARSMFTATRITAPRTPGEKSAPSARKHRWAAPAHWRRSCKDGLNQAGF